MRCHAKPGGSRGNSDDGRGVEFKGSFRWRQSAIFLHPEFISSSCLEGDASCR